MEVDKKLKRIETLVRVFEFVGFHSELSATTELEYDTSLLSVITVPFPCSKTVSEKVFGLYSRISAPMFSWTEWQSLVVYWTSSLHVGIIHRIVE